MLTVIGVGELGGWLFLDDYLSMLQIFFNEHRLVLQFKKLF